MLEESDCQRCFREDETILRIQRWARFGIDLAACFQEIGGGTLDTQVGVKDARLGGLTERSVRPYFTDDEGVVVDHLANLPWEEEEGHLFGGSTFVLETGG